MLRPTIIKVLLKQFPGSHYAFWDQVLRTVETVQRDERLYVPLNIHEPDGFTIPPMTAFPITPVRPGFDFANTCSDDDSVLFSTLHDHANPWKCLSDSKSPDSGNLPPANSSCPDQTNAGPQHGDDHGFSRDENIERDPFRNSNGNVPGDLCAPLANAEDSVSLEDIFLTDPKSSKSIPDQGAQEVRGPLMRSLLSTSYVEQTSAISTSAISTFKICERNAPSPSKTTSSAFSRRTCVTQTLVKDSGNGSSESESGQEVDGVDDSRYTDKGHGSTHTVFEGPDRRKKRTAAGTTEWEPFAKIVKADCQHLVPVTEVEAEFRWLNTDIEDVSLVRDLLRNIGSPETIRQLKIACTAARDPGSCVTSDDDIACSVKAIGELEDEQLRIPMLYRYHWLKVVQWRDEEVRKHVCQGRAKRTATTLALRELMRIRHPTLRPGEKWYGKKYKELIQRTSYAHHWLELQQEFSIGFLAVIPSADLLDCPPYKIENMNNGPFRALFHLLVRYRGDFLKSLSQRLLNIFDILLQKRPTTRYKFEQMADLRNIAYDSSELLDSCTQVS